MSKLVSIIVLTYRKFDNLERNLASIKMQDHDHYEVIIQDDGSPNFDRTAVEALVEKIGLENVKIETNPENLGTVKNYNRAIRRSSGEIIMPLSQDDVFIDERVVSDVAAFFEETGCLLCTAKWKGADSGRVWPSETDCRLLERGDPSELFGRLFTFGRICSGCTMYFAREIFEKIGLFDEEFCLCEDIPFLLKALVEGVAIAFLNRITILYGEGGVSKWVGKPPPQTIRDVRLRYEKLILPNLSLIKSKRVRRRAQFTYMVMYGHKGTADMLLRSIGYLDVILIGGLGIVLSTVKKYDGIEYQLLSGRLFR